MAKRFFIVFVLFLIIAGVWHFAWQYTQTKLQFALQQQIEKLEKRNPNIKTTYKLSPYGYPFKAGFSIEKMRLDMVSGENKASAIFKGTHNVYVSLKNIPRAILNKGIVYRTEIENFEGSFTIESDGRKVSTTFMAVRSVGEGVFDKNVSYKGIASDVDFYLTTNNLNKQRMLTINNISIDTSKYNENDLHNISEKIEILGATFFDIEGKDSLNVDNLSIGFDLKNIPDMTDFSKSFKKMSAQKIENGIDMSDFKKQLEAQAQSFLEHNTRLNLNEFNIKIEDFSGSVSGNLMLNKQFQPEGDLQINLLNADALMNKYFSKNMPFVIPFSATGKKIEFNIKAKNGALLFNGFPIIMNLPSVVDIIQKLPVTSKKPASVPVEILDASLVEQVFPTDINANEIKNPSKTFVDVSLKEGDVTKVDTIKIDAATTVDNTSKTVLNDISSTTISVITHDVTNTMVPAVLPWRENIQVPVIK